MKEVLKKSITFVICVCMILSAMPVGAFALTDNVQTDVRNDISTQATSAFGGMLTDAIDTQDIDADSPYFISDLIFDGNKATASYYNEALCTLVVAVYDEETEQMLDSAVTSVEAESLEKAVSFSSLPENFVAKAFLLDESNASLCKPYTCNENTTAYKEFIGKTVEDFDEDRVINLDESLTNNFVVLTDDTIIVNGNNETNVLESADVENDEYIFSNIDEQIKNLRVGDMFYLDNGDEENITVIKIASISVDGDKAVIIADNTTLAEAFEYVKIDTEAQTDDMGYDGTNADEGVTYLGNVDYETGEPIAPDGSEIGTQAVEIEGDASYSKKFEYKADCVKTDLVFKATVKVKVHITKEYGEVSLTLNPSVKVSLEITKKFPLKEISFGEFGIRPMAGVYINLKPTFVMEFSGKITVSGELTFTLGVGWKSGSGIVNKCKKPSFKPVVKVEVTFFVGFDLKPELAVIHENVASASMSGTAGAEIKVTKSTDNGENHSCTNCNDGDIQGRITIKANVSIAKHTKFGGDLSATLLNLKFKIADFYFSLTYASFGWGECPYKNAGVDDGSDGDGSGDSGEVVAPPGYVFDGYDENGDPIFIADSNTCYTVEIYIMGSDGKYGEPEIVTFYGTTDSVVTYVPDIPDGYSLNNEKSVLCATVSGDGSTVLRVYIDRLYIELGSYPQSLQDDGTYKVEPIKWRVLSNEGNGLLLISENILDVQYFSQGLRYTWEESTLRRWLNDDFYNSAFNDNEKGIIKTTLLSKNVADNVYLLLSSDLSNSNYKLNSNELRMAAGTDYAKSKNLLGNYWWLRNDVDCYGAHAVQSNGTIISQLTKDGNRCGVRPVIRIDTDTSSSVAEYAVEVYTMDIDGKYREQEIVKLYAKPDSVVTYIPDLQNGYSLNDEKSILYATVSGDGSSVLKVYIDRVHIELGSYPQSLQEDGTYKVEPIKWRVLSNEDNELFLISENILDAQYLTTKSTGTNLSRWENCTLRTWLNNDFYNAAFNDNEKERIKTTQISNNVADKVYILSYSAMSVSSYNLNSNELRMATGTDYAKSKNLVGNYWWLRIDGRDNYDSYAVNSNGEIRYNLAKNLNLCGVRPVIRIDTTASSSLGTQSVSYTLDNGIDTLGFSYDKCIAGNTYTLLNVTDYGEGFELSSDNLYYINTVSADENGKVIASFIPKTNAENSVILLVGDFGNGTETVVVDEWYNEYTVTWNTDGETVTQTVIEGAEIIAPENPEKVGYTFTGWTPSIPATMPDYDLAFTATWAVNNYDAVFNANSGAWADGTTKKTVPTEYSSEIITPEPPVKQGYTFTGWTPSIPDEMPDYDLTFTATCTAPMRMGKSLPNQPKESNFQLFFR